MAHMAGHGDVFCDETDLTDFGFTDHDRRKKT